MERYSEAGKIMEIIERDNFGREGPGHDDRFVVYVKNAELAYQICVLLNRERGDASATYFAVVEDNYKLYRFEP